MPWCGIGPGLLLATLAAAQPGVEQLDRFLRRMGEDLKRLPNYTCTETIERWRHPSGCSGCSVMDRLRLEVAVLGSRERFALPGGGGFEDKELDQMVASGATLSGDFSGFANGVFFANGAAYTYAGEEKLEGRRAARYEYRVAAEHSGFRLGVGGMKRIVAYGGSFWVDPQSLDLLKLEVSAGPLPPELKVERATVATAYARERIAGGEFLLPRTTELVLVHRDGERTRNLTRYSGCRQYVGESKISFGENESQAPQAAVIEARPDGGAVAAHVPVEAALDRALRLDDCAVGDPVTATVMKAARRDGVVAVPKGARLHGRVVRMEQRFERRPVTLVALDFFTLESGGTPRPFQARLREAGAFLAGRPNQVFVTPQGRQAVLVMAGTHHVIPKGFRFYWETLEEP